jgi:4-hydroxythreonine-4-phosphate dehydrogenase
VKKNELNFIGITMGDPAGIGPEICIKSAVQLENNNYTPLLIGRYDLFEQIISKLSIDFDIIKLTSLKDFNSLNNTQKKKLYIFDVPTKSPIPLAGEGSPLTGKQSLDFIDSAIHLWKTKFIHAVVTGPVSKSNIENSGTHFIGHTEYIASHTGGNPHMLMYSKNYSVLLVSTHASVYNLSSLINYESIKKAIYSAHYAFSKILKSKPKIAVAGLDPHCGDGGAISTFDTDVTKKVVQELNKEDINVLGPFAADTLFLKEKWKSFDVAIAMYHDQGLIPFKMLAFEEGVNITLGLPIVRTSVDHGTAFDIAGKFTASCLSMIKAFEVAEQLISF